MMKEVLKFLIKNKVFYLATSSGDLPHVRPMGFVMEHDGKLAFCTSNQKAMFKQLTANPPCRDLLRRCQLQYPPPLRQCCILHFDGNAAEDAGDDADARQDLRRGRRKARDILPGRCPGHMPDDVRRKAGISGLTQ